MANSQVTPARSPRSGTPSADVFRLVHGRAIIGEYWSEKAGDGHPGRILHASSIDRALGLWLEFHPLVVCYQRADLRDDQLAAWRLSAPFGASLPIAFHSEGHELVHYPDYQGRWIDGTPFVADAGTFESLVSGRVLAAAEATRLAMRIAGGRYFIGTETTISPRLHWNLINLHARRRHHDPERFKALADEIRQYWLQGRSRSIREVAASIASGRWAEGEVQCAAWKIVADAAASGRLLIIGVLDTVELDLDLDTPLELLPPDLPPVIPKPLPDRLQLDPPMPRDPVDLLQAGTRQVPGPTIDEAELAMLPRVRSMSAEQREHLLATVRRNRAVTEAWQSGASYRHVAAQFGIQASQVHHLVQRVLKHGQRALIPHAVYDAPRRSDLHPQIQNCIRSLYSRAIRLGPTAVWESPELEVLRKSLDIPEPSYWQVYRFCKHLEATEPSIQAKRTGLRSIPRGLTSLESIISSVRAPGLICQVDEHQWDGRFVGRNGVIIRGRVHIGVIICVATGAILGAVTSARPLTEWDYMRLLKQAMEPKEQLKLIHGFVNDWDVAAKPQLILSDRGSIFVSKHAIEVVCDRFGILADRAPPRDPEAKGQIESVFTWLTRKVAHRIAGTTKSNPERLGDVYQPVIEAEKAGITYEVFQDLLYQSVVDGYMREWDDRRGGRRYQLWHDAVEQYGIQQFSGSPDDLILLLMKRMNRRDGSTRGYTVHANNSISYKNRTYVCPGVFEALVGKEVALYVNEEDERVVYPFYEAAYVGSPAVCRDLVGRSPAWALELERAETAREARAAAAESRENRRRSGAQLLGGRRANLLRAERQQATREALRQDDQNKHAELMTPRDHLFLRALAAVRSDARHRAIPSEEDMDGSVDNEPFIPVQAPIVRFCDDDQMGERN